MRQWRSWICTQSRQTMQQLRQGVPLNQLGGYSNAMGLRGAAAFGYYENEDDVVQAFRTAMFTHKETTAHQVIMMCNLTAGAVRLRLTQEECIQMHAAMQPTYYC